MNNQDQQKTYCEIQGQKPFNWNEFLNRKKRSKDEWAQASLLSLDWVTCACGNQCDLIPRGHGGSPVDATLRKLGGDFHTKICSYRAKDAREILHKIEKRSGALLEQLTFQVKKTTPKKALNDYIQKLEDDAIEYIDDQLFTYETYSMAEVKKYCKNLKNAGVKKKYRKHIKTVMLERIESFEEEQDDV